MGRRDQPANSTGQQAVMTRSARFKLQVGPVAANGGQAGQPPEAADVPFRAASPKSYFASNAMTMSASWAAG